MADDAPTGGESTEGKPPRNHYETLGVDPGADATVIEAAYRARSLRFRVGLLDHRLPGLAGPTREEVERAYAVLGDPEARARYDAELFPGRPPARSSLSRRRRVAAGLWWALAAATLVAGIALGVLWATRLAAPRALDGGNPPLTGDPPATLTARALAPSGTLAGTPATPAPAASPSLAALVPTAPPTPAPTATPSPRPSPSPTPTPTPPPTATPSSPTAAPPPSPTPTPQPSLLPLPPSPPPAPAVAPLVTSGACRLRLPLAFVEEPGSPGYYPAADRSGFAALDALLSVPGATLDGVARRHLGALRTMIPDYRETGVARDADGLRVELAGTLEGEEARGVAYFRQSGPTVCAVTLFLQRRSPIALEDTLQALLASLEVVR